MKAKNHVITAKSADEAEALAQEYRDATGRDVTVDRRTNTITVMAMPTNYKKKREREEKLKRGRERTLEPWETRYAEYS